MGRAIVFHASTKLKGGSNNLVHVIKGGGGHYFLCKVAGVKESI